MRKYFFFIPLLFFQIVFAITDGISQNAMPSGEIKGIVIDKDSKAPLIGAYVMLIGTQRGAATDNEGKFSIPRVPVGSYVIRISYIGYGMQTKTDIIVRPQRVTYVEAARRSYLDVLVDAIDVGTSVAPVYGDLQGKLIYEINPRHKLTALAIWGDDHNNPDQETAKENDMIFYGK